MSALPSGEMTVDEFLSWAERQPGHTERYGRTVCAMPRERAGHAKVNFAVQSERGITVRAADRQRRTLADGTTVRVGEDTAHEPHALAYHHPELLRNTVAIDDPIIVVDVLASSTRHTDAPAKLIGYFQRLRAYHYLIVAPEGRPTRQHQQQADGKTLTSIVPAGTIKLDPPGIDSDAPPVFS